ncbi:MAG: GNAT family N-acetyltransferase [Proteobacteria bacterium]|nr:GNAT family N-acetyltransferase [Pseudomonadota bacterium]
MERVVQRIESLNETELEDLCNATAAAIIDGGGFGWVRAPTRETLERYWQGVLLVPERTLVVARLGGTIAGSAQLVRAPKHNEAQAFAGQLTASFIAPWARGHGLARMLVQEIEQVARSLGLKVLNLDVRATQKAAIQLYESLAFTRWGTHPCYAIVNGDSIPGHYYYKRLDEPGP